MDATTTMYVLGFAGLWLVGMMVALLWPHPNESSHLNQR